jgi:hypothetical protein
VSSTMTDTILEKNKNIRFCKCAYRLSYFQNFISVVPWRLFPNVVSLQILHTVDLIMCATVDVGGEVWRMKNHTYIYICNKAFCNPRMSGDFYGTWKC